jgi:acyl-CoA thioesterase
MEQPSLPPLSAATTLTPTGDASWRASVSPQFGGPAPGFAFGGYLAALMLRAVGHAAAHPMPISFTMHYRRPVRLDAQLDIAATRLGQGRRTESLRLTADVDGECALEVLAWVGVPTDGPEFRRGSAPAVDGRDGLIRHDELVEASGRRAPSTMAHWEKRLSLERPSLSASESDLVYREWSRIELRADRDLFDEAGRYVLPVDANPWQAVRHARGLLDAQSVDYLMPTLELTAHFHQFAPESEWLLHETVAPVAANGYSSGITRVWTETGDLVATGLSAVTFRRV